MFFLPDGDKLPNGITVPPLCCVFIWRRPCAAGTRDTFTTPRLLFLLEVSGLPGFRQPCRHFSGTYFFMETVQKRWIGSLRKAELLLVGGDFKASLDEASGLLSKVISMTVLTEKTRSSVAPTLLPGQHMCTHGCVCQAAVLVCLQALYGLRRFSKIDALLLKYTTLLSRSCHASSLLLGTSFFFWCKVE